MEYFSGITERESLVMILTGNFRLVNDSFFHKFLH